MPAELGCGKQAWSQAVKVGNAKGSVTLDVPKDKAVMLELNTFAWQHPDCLQHVSPQGIDSLKTSFRMMDDNETCDRILKFVPNLKGLAFLDLEGSDATDAGVSSVRGMSHLKVIYLAGCPVRGSCLKELSSVPTISRLMFMRNPLDLNNLKYLSSIRGLRELKLDDVQLTNTAIKSIAQCQTLQRLWLPHNVALDDRCITYLRELKNLKLLDLRRTSISVRGIKSLSSLQIDQLLLPRAEYTPDEIAGLRAAFAHTTLTLDKGRTKHLNDTAPVLLAPLSDR